MSEDKKIEVVPGDGKDLEISPVYEHIEPGKPKNLEKDKPRNIVIPKPAKNKSENDK